MFINSKTIRQFKDLDGNIYAINKKVNNHYYLTIKAPNENGAKIINGSKNKIFYYLAEIRKNTKFMDM